MRAKRLGLTVVVWVGVLGFYWLAGAIAWPRLTGWMADEEPMPMEYHSEDLGVGCIAMDGAIECVPLPLVIPGMGRIPSQ